MLSDDTRKALAAVMETEVSEAGHAVVTEGRVGYAFYVIDSGYADVVHEGQQLRRLGPGDFFGEIAIIAGRRRTASVTTTSHVRMLVFVVRMRMIAHYFESKNVERFIYFVAEFVVTGPLNNVNGSVC